MKINSRSFRKFKSLVIVYILFCLMFPYNLFAAEGKYKVPKNSISYFTQNPTQELAVVAPPAPIEEPAVTAPAPVEPALSPVVTEMEEAPMLDTKDEHLEMTWDKESTKEPEKIEQAVAKTSSEIKNQEKERPAPIVTQKIETKMVASVPATMIPESQIVTSPKDNSNTAFAEVLSRMQKRSAERKAEAEKLGIVLPSQGGDMNAVSPSLNKINETIKNILNRHHCPPTGNCNFCK